eukprot:Skav234627  [mRNA]  locus=scaffold171:168383:168668:- [translate_table: standard]
MDDCWCQRLVFNPSVLHLPLLETMKREPRVLKAVDAMGHDLQMEHQLPMINHQLTLAFGEETRGSY